MGIASAFLYQGDKDPQQERHRATTQNDHSESRDFWQTCHGKVLDGIE